MQTSSTRAYLADPALRSLTLDRMRAHAAADEIIQGRYWERGKGCLVGCAIHEEPAEGRHAAFPRIFGIPEILAGLADCIFEGLTPTEAKTLPVAFFEAIPLGADLSLAWPRFALALMTDPEHGVARLAAEGTHTRAAIDDVAALFTRQIQGDTVSRREWDAAAASAYAAAASASAASASAASASAASASAYAASDAAHYAWQASTILAILASCPVTA